MCGVFIAVSALQRRFLSGAMRDEPPQVQSRPGEAVSTSMLLILDPGQRLEISLRPGSLCYS